jgi:TonB family protein
MHSFSGFAAGYLVNAVWETALIFLAGWLASRMLMRLGPRAEHAVWVGALFAAVVTPAIPALRLLPAVLGGAAGKGGSTAAILVADQGGAPLRTSVLSLPQNWLWCLLALYIVSELLFAGRLILSSLAATRLLRHADPATLTPDQEETWLRCKQAFSLPRARMLVSADAPGPVALGFRGPVLLMPAGFASRCTPEDFLVAVAHECAHHRRRDYQKNLLYEVASLALAFHPLIWVIKSRIAQTREMICDAMAVEGHVDARSYARSLLRLAAMVAEPAIVSTVHAIGIFDAGILEKRIMRIRMKKHQTRALLKYSLIVPAALFISAVALGSGAMALVVEPQPALASASGAAPFGFLYHGKIHAFDKATVYKVGNGVSAPIPLNTVEAEFPKAVRKDKKVPGGIVVVRLIVDAEGMPRDARVVRSYRPDFDAEALKAVKKYRFKPAMREGKPVAVAISIQVNFKRY